MCNAGEKSLNLGLELAIKFGAEERTARRESCQFSKVFSEVMVKRDRRGDFEIEIRVNQTGNRVCLRINACST